jgi:hypothetical protein
MQLQLTEDSAISTHQENVRYMQSVTVCEL